MPFYRLFGFDLESDAVIHGLFESAAVGPACSRVKLTFGELPDWVENLLPHTIHIGDGWDGRRILRYGSGCCAWFRYGDGTEFVIDDDGARIWATWTPDLTFEDMLAYLVGPVVGYLARLRDVPVLHASGVVVDGRVMALMGPSGAGKSTTAAALVRRGFPLITEDVMALAQQGAGVLVQPGYTRIKLWEPSVAMLFGSPTALPRIVPKHPTWDKRFFDVGSDAMKFSSSPAPLAAIYVLGERREAETSLIAGLAGRDAVSFLVANSYGQVVLSKSQRAHEFAVFSGIARTIPIRRVVARPDLGELDSLCDALVTDFRACTTAADPTIPLLPDPTAGD